MNNMNNHFEDTIALVNSLSGDFKVELIAAELLKKGVTEDALQFKNLSNFNRSISKDIESIKLNVDDFKQLIEFQINREGIYDILPEAIFHYNASKKRNQKEVLDEIKKNREEENAARDFLLPFENEFYIKRLYLELQHQLFLKFDSVDNNRLLFESLYSDFKDLEDTQILCLLYIIPLAHKIRADLEKARYCIYKLIGLPITIEPTKLRIHEYTSNFSDGVGYSYLGINTIVGNTVQSSTKTYKIEISDIQLKQLPSFFTNQNFRVFLNCLISLILPANCYFDLILEVKPSENRAFISTDDTFSFLNYNSYI